MWKIDTTMTDVEAVFRSLKSELGQRPIYYQIERRLEGAFVHQCMELPPPVKNICKIIV